MFGGLAFLLRGNMCVGVHRDDLIVRADPDEGARALSEPGVRPFDLTGRPMKGWLMIEAKACATDGALRRWLDAGVTFASSLPPKA